MANQFQSPQMTGFRREEGYSLQTGMAVRYVLHGYKFDIVITREGIKITGSFPMVDTVGVNMLIDMLRRANRHYTHLKSFPIGERQSILDEAILIAEEMSDEMAKTSDRVVG